MFWLTLWGLARMLSPFAYEAAGAVGAGLSLRPLLERGTTRDSNPGKNVPRECFALFSRHCEERSDGAIHASACGAMDCLASLAMTPVCSLKFESNRLAARLQRRGPDRCDV